MTKKNINNVKFLKKIVKKKEREDKEWHPSNDVDMQVKMTMSKVFCVRHNE